MQAFTLNTKFKFNKLNLKCFKRPCAPHTNAAGAHLETVLFSHDSLGFPLVAGLPGGSHALRGQVSPRRSPLPLRQVKIHDLEAHLVAHQVLQLWSKGRNGTRGDESEKRPEVPMTPGVGPTAPLTCRMMLWMTLSMVKPM